MERNATSEGMRPARSQAVSFYCGNAPQIVRNFSTNGCSLELARMLLNTRHGSEDITPRR